jgi:signal transduction histidine kinase
VLRNMSENEEHLNVLKSLGIKSYICVPIVAHGKNLGAFTMASETNNFDTSDLGFAEDLATRAALSLYNSNLYQSAHEALQARDEFLSIASHELKTPLTTLKLQAQLQSRLLKEDASGSLSSDRLATYLDKSEGLVNRLDRLIDDMLDISRIRTGKLTINKERVNLSAVTKEVVDRLQSQSVAATGHRISFQAPEVLNCDVDVMRIEQVITNLVQNALKYGQGKSVDVTLSLESDSFVFSVSDKGMGISEENQLKIFQRFERVSDTSGISGLGLGLYISHQIVKAHGGEIWVVSNLGQGSTFFVRLPEMTFS